LRALDAENGNAELAVLIPLQEGFMLDWMEKSMALPAEAIGKNIVLEWRLQTDAQHFLPLPGWYIDDVEVIVP
jgi:hypothetical protein